MNIPTELSNELREELCISNSNIPEFTLDGMLLYGKAVYIYDGDTVHIVFNLNNKLTKFICRLNGIDTPEICPKNITDLDLRKKQVESALKSRDYLIEKLTDQQIDKTKNKLTKKDIKELCNKSKKIVLIKCHQFDKYGRLLVEIFLDNNITCSINNDMVTNNYAYVYNGKTKEIFD